MMMYVYWYCARKHGMGSDQVFRWKTLGVTFIAALPALLTPVIILRRHDIRLVHADRSRDRGMRLGADARG